jgi:serine/threonine protein kinase
VLKILDFGIATPFRTSTSDGGATKFDSRRLGALSPCYACVEMFLGNSADPRDDVFSAAVVVYELLSGKHPFGGEEAPRAEEANRAVEPIAGLSRAQNLALRSALGFRRTERTASIADFASELLQGQRRRRFPWPRAGIAGLLLAAALAGAAIFYGWSGAGVHAPDSPLERLHAGLVPVRAEGPCPQLERGWGEETCPKQVRQCFEDRANAAEVSRLRAAPDQQPMFRSLSDLYRDLAIEPCASLPQRYLREVESFVGKYPGQRMN